MRRICIVVLGLCVGLAMADDGPPPCPGAEAWKAEHPDDSPEAVDQRDAARQFTEPELRSELEKRFDTDQRARRAYLLKPLNTNLRFAVERVDADNHVWLERLIRDRGVPTAEQVGENGVKWTWVLVQHTDTDPKFQAAVLPQFEKRFAAHELSADAFAKLSDRVLLAQGKPQQFGTQFNWLSGHFDPKGVDDIAEIDAHRRAIGLMPLADYGCLVNQRLKNRDP